MSKWFRNEEWSPAIEENFLGKLSRARASNKPQYLCVQAYYLTERRPEISLSLLDRYFELGDKFHDAPAYLHQAHAFETLGDRERSEASLEKAVLREREFPNHLTQAGFEFPLFVATHKMTAQYELARQVIEECRPKATLPVERFCSFAASALMAVGAGVKSEGAEFARLALSAAGSRSPFRRHTDIGLVGSKYDELIAQLQGLAGGS